MGPLLVLEGVSRDFTEADGSRLPVLRGVDLIVHSGDTVSIAGRSGTGKSTLLHVAAGIERPTTGAVRLLGHDLAALSDRERSRLRGRAVGLVFQAFHLVPYRTVRENILLPAWIAGCSRSPASEASIEDEADQLLEAVGLGGRQGEPARILSGGEMQRVAIARALLLRPSLLLADEPTGNLDGATAGAVTELLFGLAAARRAALVVVTHNRRLASRCRIRLRLSGGRLLPSALPGPDCS